MAERRMISKKITDTDAFLDMPLSTQALYFHLLQNADDEGFVGSPKSIIRKIGANKNDYDLLLVKRFIIEFQSGICVIKHWYVHNYIAKDRFTETTYIEEKSQLSLKDNKVYTECIQDVYKLDTQYSIGKDSIDKNSIDKNSIDNSSSACTDTSVTAENTIITLDLVGNETYDLLESDYDELVSIYVGVDVMSELRKMKGWLFGHPQQRKTKRGIMKFITSWLSREQDKAKPTYSAKKETTKEKREDDWLF